MNINKAVSILVGVLFLLFAIVQYNDPDPWEWILIYGAIAFFSLLSAAGIYRKRLAYLLLVITGIWMMALIPGLWQWLRYEPMDALLYGMSPDKIYIEESREFLGLLMGAAGVFSIMRLNRRN